MTAQITAADFAGRAQAAPTSTLPATRVSIVADLVCPWCYLGFARLMRLAETTSFELAWHPFLLNPHLPAQGVPRDLYLERKFGSAMAAEKVYRRVVAAAEADLLQIEPRRIRRQPNSVKAHALLLAAAGTGRLVPTAEALFRAFFVEGRDLGSVAELELIGAEIGLGRDTVAEALAEPAGRAVWSAHDEACRMGVNGVPLFVFGHGRTIAGAQPFEVLQEMLNLERYAVGSG